MTKPVVQKNLFLFALLVMAALSRLIPHPPNFTAIGAMAIFGGAYFARHWLACILPLACLWISNLLLNNLVYSDYYSGFSWGVEGLFWVFLSFVLIMLMSRVLLQRVSSGSVLVCSLLASLVFFVVSNFGVWMSGTLYPMTIDGLVHCYLAAIPFLGNTLMGDLFYSALLFSSVALVQRKQLVTA